jgi:hypothetical protein
MKTIDAHWTTYINSLMDHVRCATPEQRPMAVGRMLRSLIPAIPLALRETPIESVRWSQCFATNEWWRSVWKRLGVSRVADLCNVGAELAATRGVGRIKLLALLQDLVDLATSTAQRPGRFGERGRTYEIIRTNLQSIESGPPSPQPYLVKGLFHALMSALPREVLAWDIRSVPWSREWCYSTSLWSDLGVSVVADLDEAAFEMSQTRGIGRGKIVMLARELIYLTPELEAILGLQGRQGDSNPDTKPSSRPIPAPPRPGSLVASIDRMAERLSTRERDILLRRIGWRYDQKPEKLRTLSKHHGVSQERVRQIEGHVRKRILNLMHLRQFPAALRDAVRSFPLPADLEAVIACRPAEFRGMMEVWKPLAVLLAANGGPYLYEDSRRNRRVVVSLVPISPRASTARRGSPAPASETAMPCPSATPAPTC